MCLARPSAHAFRTHPLLNRQLPVTLAAVASSDRVASRIARIFGWIAVAVLAFFVASNWLLAIVGMRYGPDATINSGTRALVATAALGGLLVALTATRSRSTRVAIAAVLIGLTGCGAFRWHQTVALLESRCPTSLDLPSNPFANAAGGDWCVFALVDRNRRYTAIAVLRYDITAVEGDRVKLRVQRFDNRGLTVVGETDALSRSKPPTYEQFFRATALEPLNVSRLTHFDMHDLQSKSYHPTLPDAIIKDIYLVNGFATVRFTLSPLVKAIGLADYRYMHEPWYGGAEANLKLQPLAQGASAALLHDFRQDRESDNRVTVPADWVDKALKAGPAGEGGGRSPAGP